MEKISEAEERLCRYVDGEMAPEERVAFERLLAGDEGLRGELEAMRRAGDVARRVVADYELPAPELFREQVMREIGAGAVGRRAERAAGGRWWRSGWQGLPWAVAGLSAAAAVVMALVDLRGGEGGVGQVRPSVLVGAYAPQESVTVEWRYDRGAQATVIDLEGLPELPADFDVAGLRVGGTERGLASTTLLERDGTPMMVVVHDGRSAPRGFRTH